MRILTSGIPNRDFTTIDVTLTNEFDGLKITADDRNTQMHLIISNDIELKQFKKLVKRMKTTSLNDSEGKNAN